MTIDATRDPAPLRCRRDIRAAETGRAPDRCGIAHRHAPRDHFTWAIHHRRRRPAASALARSLRKQSGRPVTGRCVDDTRVDGRNTYPQSGGRLTMRSAHRTGAMPHCRPQARHLHGIGLTAAVLMAVTLATLASADSSDGLFPTADQVGGQVFPNGIKQGDAFPTDFKIYDDTGQATDLAQVIKDKRTLVTFFISAAPVSISELKKIQDTAKAARDTQVIFVNADTVGVALLGGQSKAISETARTVRVIRQEEKLEHAMFVAPNDALSPTGLSNRLGFRGLPTSYLVDKNGKVERVYVGPQAWKQGDL
ncbi:TlpA family protein disulfide reductase [Rhodoplanes serenus]|uniref:TlpA family protein disulfide reductase n=1 Tax=Rhodoplanes serenus TaxID=200615 RepID=UPI001AEC94F8|nr:redoxin family protein [Rhodoplanes serenus]